MKDLHNITSPWSAWSRRTPKRAARTSVPMSARTHRDHLFSLFGDHRAWAAALAKRKAKDRAETPERMEKAMLRQPEPRPVVRLISPDPRRADWKRPEVVEARAAKRAKRSAHGELARQKRRAS